MKITHLTESKKLPGQGGALIMSPEEFVQADEQGIDVDPNEVGAPKKSVAKSIKDIDEDAVLTRKPVRMNAYVQLADKIHDAMMAASQRNDLGTYEKLKLKYLELEKKVQQRGMVPEATELPAPQREFGDEEFQDYMTRIKGVPDIDKKTGLPKMTKGRVTKTGIVHPPEQKFVSGKTKTDKYKLPYVHRSSVVTYYDAEGKRFREEDVINALKVRPKKLLKQNEKMKHSNGELEQFFNVGFAALTGIAVDESTNKLIIVNTCPGAGSCKVDCFAMKGGKVQFKNAWLSDGKILTYLLNDPTGFFNRLSAEISKQEKDGDKGGYTVTIRWHDAGDFFSPEYLDLALKMAEKHPGVKFYAYTKMAGAALANKPGNFIINWSEGAHTSQEKQVKKDDPELEKTKNSRIVPEDLFYDLLKKDAKGNLDKEGADAEGNGGRWVMRDEAAKKELKQRLADYYKISPSSILDYDEYTSKPLVQGMKYNVIVAPGEGDISANDRNVLSTLLLKH